MQIYKIPVQQTKKMLLWLPAFSEHLIYMTGKSLRSVAASY